MRVCSTNRDCDRLEQRIVATSHGLEGTVLRTTVIANFQSMSFSASVISLNIMLILGTMVIKHSAYNLCLEVQSIGAMIQLPRHSEQTARIQ
jgi:hypothetical protein